MLMGMGQVPSIRWFYVKQTREVATLSENRQLCHFAEFFWLVGWSSFRLLNS